MLRKSDFDYHLPEHLIAQSPLESRTASRLLTLDGHSGNIGDRLFVDLLDLLSPGDLLVFNNTRVIPARLYGKKATGGKVEVLVERVLDENRFLAHTRSNKSMKPGTVIEMDGRGKCTVAQRQGELWELELQAAESILELLDSTGHIPLPPYIQRSDDDKDRQRYQTVYAEVPGAVAAPTAGLHFDVDIIQRIKDKGIKTRYITLHVGSGTFQPVRVENLEDHHMHFEVCHVDQTVVDAVNEVKANGGKVIAVGTTSVRALEASSVNGELKAFSGETDLFIKPGFRFSCVDCLITNFHLPESTLLTLVCAFAGYSKVMGAYHHAVQNEYRFFSYGDAMFLTRSD